MPVGFEHWVSGGQISRALAGDPEEMAYFLKDLIEDAPDDFFAAVADFLNPEERQEIAAFLTLFAQTIGGCGMTRPLDKDAIDAAARRLRAALDRLPPLSYDTRAAYEAALVVIETLVRNEGGIAGRLPGEAYVSMHGLRATSTAGLTLAVRNWLAQAAAKAGVTA